MPKSNKNTAIIMRASDTCNFCKLLITDRSITHKVNRSEDSENCWTYIWDNDMRSFKAYFFHPSHVCNFCGRDDSHCERFACGQARNKGYERIKKFHKEFEEDFAWFQRQLIFEIWAVNQLQLPKDVKRHIILKFIRRPVEYNAAAIYRAKKRVCHDCVML